MSAGNMILQKRSPFKANACLEATPTIGVESTNTINVSVQLKDAKRVACAERVSIGAYLSDDANGDTLAATAPSSGVAIGTNGLLITQVTNKAWRVVSEANGIFDITISEAGVATWYLILVMPDGSLRSIGPITFA